MAHRHMKGYNVPQNLQAKKMGSQRECKSKVISRHIHYSWL